MNYYVLGHKTYPLYIMTISEPDNKKLNVDTLFFLHKILTYSVRSIRFVLVPGIPDTFYFDKFAKKSEARAKGIFR